MPFLEVRVKDFRHAPVPTSGFGSTTLGSAPSLDNLQGSSNFSRRMSLNPSLLTTSNSLSVQNQNRKLSLNPASVGKDSTTSDPVSEKSDQLREGDQSALFNTSELENITNCVNADSPTADPLGAIQNMDAKTTDATANPSLTVTSTSEDKGDCTENPVAATEQPLFETDRKSVV